MTWIIGASAALGYAVGISDIRVTLANGSERDCLQKIYPISRFIAAGFAGSVRIGFSMLNALAHHLRDLPDGAAWFPEDVADDFAEIARRVFGNSEPIEQELRSHLIVLGAHPIEDVGIPGYARCSVHILKSPDFTPLLARIGEVVSIGSGSTVARYQEILDGFSSNTLSLLQGEVMGAGTGFLPLSMVVQKTVEKNPTPGISSHAHICVVRRGVVTIFPNDEDRYPPTGEIIHVRTPPVATTWDEFVQIISSSSQSPNGAVCCILS